VAEAPHTNATIRGPPSLSQVGSLKFIFFAIRPLHKWPPVSFDRSSHHIVTPLITGKQTAVTSQPTAPAGRVCDMCFQLVIVY